MSHFVVGVICNDPGDIDRLLAPYSEVNEEYYSFHPVFNNKNEAMAAYEAEDHLIKDKYNFDDWCNVYHNYEVIGNKYGHNYNDNAKWDWYTVGGRWDGEMEEYLKDNVDLEQCYFKVGDYNFGLNERLANEAEAFWEGYVEGKDPDAEDLFKPSYYTSLYKNKYEYINSMAYPCTPFAFVDSDGNWFENGKMGWFACHDGTRQSRMTYEQQWKMATTDINNQDKYLVWVDCHI